MVKHKGIVKKINGLEYKIIRKLFSDYPSTRPYVTKHILRKENCEYYSGTMRQLFHDLYDIDVGFGSYGWYNSGFRPHVSIGAYCSIAKGVQRFAGNHPMEMFSTHPFFHRDKFGYYPEHYDYKSLEIGNDVWIGINVIITAGCEKIGDGAVIGAGSVVTHDVQPYEVVAGNPARHIRYRFNEEERKLLIESRWYELEPEELSQIKEYSEDIPRFVEEVKKIKANKNMK